MPGKRTDYQREYMRTWRFAKRLETMPIDDLEGLLAELRAKVKTVAAERERRLKR